MQVGLGYSSEHRRIPVSIIRVLLAGVSATKNISVLHYKQLLCKHLIADIFCTNENCFFCYFVLRIALITSWQPTDDKVFKSFRFE